MSEEAALDALARRSQFNVIDFATGWKFDFIIIKSREFSRAEFARRDTLEVESVALSVASAEDVLIAKLEWAKLGGSARQIEDAAGIIRLQGARLDRVYIEKCPAVCACPSCVPPWQPDQPHALHLSSVLSPQPRFVWPS